MACPSPECHLAELKLCPVRSWVPSPMPYRCRPALSLGFDYSASWKWDVFLTVISRFSSVFAHNVTEFPTFWGGIISHHTHIIHIYVYIYITYTWIYLSYVALNISVQIVLLGPSNYIWYVSEMKLLAHRTILILISDTLLTLHCSSSIPSSPQQCTQGPAFPNLC